MSSNDSENRMHEFDNVPGSNAQATMAAGPSDEIQAMELSSFLDKNKPDDAFTGDTSQSLSHSSSGLSTQTYHSENQFSGQEKEKFPDTNTVDTHTTASLSQSKSSLTCCTFEDTTTNAPSTNGDNKLTPEGKTVQHWKQLSISPTNLISVNDAILRSREDEIESMDFYQNGKQAIKRAVLFLYGVGYRSSETKEHRINGIKCLVSKRNRRRLIDFVFEGFLNLRSLHSKTKSFFTMAVVLKRYFSNDADADVNQEKFGYFPGKPFARYQRGSNENCYEPASSVWASLVIRHQDPTVEKNYVVDVGQRTRRYILHDKKKIDQRIDDRVINNASGYSREYASLIVDGKKMLEENLYNEEIWEPGSFKPVKGRWCIDCVNELGPGLITNFLLTEKFREAGSKESDGCGYWMFDGDNVDVEGEWISYEDDVEYKEQLSAIVEKEMSDAETAHQNLKREMEDLFGSNENDTIPTLTTATNPENKVNENTSHEGSIDFHAMVLLGGHMISDGAKKKIYFMCQNSWHTMPLVVCSQNYLEACQAKVLFRVRKIGSELRDCYLSSSNLIADCASPYSSGREDVNDNTDLALMFANESSNSTSSLEPRNISNFTFNDCFDSDDNDNDY